MRAPPADHVLDAVGGAVGPSTLRRGADSTGDRVPPGVWGAARMTGRAMATGAFTRWPGATACAWRRSAPAWVKRTVNARHRLAGNGEDEPIERPEERHRRIQLHHPNCGGGVSAFTAVVDNVLDAYF